MHILYNTVVITHPDMDEFCIFSNLYLSANTPVCMLPAYMHATSYLQTHALATYGFYRLSVVLCPAFVSEVYDIAEVTVKLFTSIIHNCSHVIWVGTVVSRH